MAGAGGADLPPGRRGWLAPLSLSLAYLALAVAYQRAVPLFEAPDEPSHVHYVAFLRSTGELPHMQGERRDVPGEGMEPPLYYLLLTPLFASISDPDPELLRTLWQASRWVYGLANRKSAPQDARVRMADGQGRLLIVAPDLAYLRPLRWGSLPFGLLAVLCTFFAARRVSGSEPFAFLCASLLAFSPQFLFVSAYVNNDIACAALGAAAFWLFSRAAARECIGRGSYAAAALLLALGVATKHSVLPVLAVTALAVFALDPRPLSVRLRDAGLAALLGLALAAPVLVTNAARFGDPFGVSAVIESAASLKGHDTFGGMSRYFLIVYPGTTFLTYWATFGWMNVMGPAWLYLSFLGFTVVGASGFLLRWHKDRRTLALLPPVDAAACTPLRRSRALSRYLAAAALATLAAHVWINLHAVAAQGRHLFGASPQIAALLALGLTSWRGRGASPASWGTARGIAAAMGGAALYGLAMLHSAYG